MKTIFLTILLLINISIFAAPVLTVLGKEGELKLNQLGLIVKYFNTEKPLSRHEVLKICEAIDNSKVVLITSGVYNCNYIFSDTSIQKAFNNLFNRKGGVYIGINSWTWMKNHPIKMWEYFDSINVKLPITYSGFKGKKSDESQISLNAPKWSATPNNTFKLLSRGYIGKPYDKSWKVLFESNNLPTALYMDNVLGKGTVIVNYCNSVHIRPVSPFLENFITHIYGKISTGNRRKKQNEIAVANNVTKIKYLNLSKKNTIYLTSAQTGATPQCPTKVDISSDNKNLYIAYKCFTSNPEKLKQRHSTRDSAVWQDDCIELFIADGIKNSANVHHFAISCRNTVYDSKNSASLWNCPNLKTKSTINKDGYQIDISIPFASLNIKPGKTTNFRMNICREARAGVKNNSYELQSYNPTTSFAIVSTMAYVGFTDNFTPPQSKSSTSYKGIKIYQVPQFQKIYGDFEPLQGTKETNKVSFVTARNDKETRPIVLLNNSDENLRYRVEPDYYLKGTKIHYSKLIEVKKLLPFRGVSKQVFFEIISKLNEAGIISVPSNDIAPLYLEVKTNLAPKKYQWGFYLVPVNANVPKKRIDVDIEVVNLTLPENLGLDFYLFGPYVAGQRYYVGNPDFTRGLFDKYITFLKDYHVNCIHVHDPLNSAIKITNGKITVSDKKSDYIFNEKSWAAANVKWSYHYGVWAVLKQRLIKAKLPSNVKDKQVKDIFELAISRWSKFIKEEGIDFNKFYVPVWDEPRSGDIEDVIISSNIVRKYGFKTNQTMANWSTLEDFKKLQNHADYWIPLEYHVTTDKNAPQIIKLLKDSKKKFSPYMCSIGGTIENYHSYFRYRGIKEFIAGANGIFLWASNSWRGNDYDSRDDKKMTGMFLFHHGNNGPIPTVRLEALREGLEDMYYLNLAKKSNNVNLKKLIDVKELQKLMERSNPKEMEDWHNKLLKSLAK